MSPISADRENLPSKSVTVPLEVPLTKILTPINGSPEKSVTKPLTLLCVCAQVV